MVRQFLHYYWLVIKRCFEGAFLVANVFGLIFLLLSNNQPNVPITISLAIFTFIFLVSNFLVWHEQVQERIKLQTQLEKIRDDTPKYRISAGAIESYSIESIIDEYAGELEMTEAQIKRQASAKTSNFGFAHTLLKDAGKINLLPTGFGIETVEEEADRLGHHLESLEKYQQKMKKTYKVPIAFEASRSDKNIEFQIEAPEGTSLFVEDEYPIHNLPRTQRPSLYDLDSSTGSQLIGNVANPNGLYPYSCAEGSKAHSKITKINANRKYDLFDDDFYVRTSEIAISLTVTIHSEKLQKKQSIEVPLIFKGAPVVLLTETDS